MQIIRTKELAFLSTAFMLLMAVVMTACSSEDNTTNQPEPYTADTPKAYTMTVEATMGEATTRALSIDNTGALIATWKTGDYVRVYNKTKGASLTGYLEPSDLGSATTTLSGSVSGNVSNGDVLLLCHKFFSFNYT